MRRARREIVRLKTFESGKGGSSEALQKFASATKGREDAAASPDKRKDEEGIQDFDGEDEDMDDDSE